MTDQQREQAWAAVHRPETSSEELAHIAAAHPEFAQAIAAHPNAPVRTAPPAPGPAGPVTTQQPWPAWSETAGGGATAAPGMGASAQNSDLNVMGIVALGVLALHAITSAFMPMMVTRLALDLGLSSMSISLLFGGVTLVWVLVAGAFALIGAQQKHKPRLRWMAISALVACGLSLLSILASLSSGLFAPLFF